MKFLTQDCVNKFGMMRMRLNDHFDLLAINSSYFQHKH